MASERLKELQDMEQQLQQGVESTEIQPVAKEVNLGAGSFRVQDRTEDEVEERKQLLRRKLVAKEQGQSNVGSWRVWAVVGMTVVSCMMLLWALFSGGTPDKYVSPTCLSTSELQKQYEDRKRFEPCPERDWLPSECLDERRTMSKSAMERCSSRFEECGYSMKLLRDCRLLE